MIAQLAPIMFMAVLSMLFGGVLLFVISKIGKKVKANKAKLEPYESGIFGQKTTTTKVPVKFYLTAILFIVFDIEAIFIYPWAIVYKDFIAEGYGLFILLEMVIFMTTLVWGLFYVWKGQALDWE